MNEKGLSELFSKSSTEFPAQLSALEAMLDHVATAKNIEKKDLHSPIGDAIGKGTCSQIKTHVKKRL